MVDLSKTVVESFGQFSIRFKGMRLALSMKGNDADGAAHSGQSTDNTETRVCFSPQHVGCFNSEAPGRKSKTKEVFDR